jgi:hypothetical protein
LVPALVLGDTSGLDPEMTRDFQTTGLTHLTAVSGANLTLLLGFLLTTARWIRVRGWWLRVVGLAQRAVVSRNPSSSVRFAPDTAVKWVSLRKRQVIKQSPEESGPVSARTPSRARDHHCTERDPKMKRIQLAAGNISKTDSLTIELMEASDPCRDHDYQAGRGHLRRMPRRDRRQAVRERNTLQ